MNKEFIPYEQALELKELSFDEECFKYYTEMGTLAIKDKRPLPPLTYAPLYQQAFRWFRNEYALHSFVSGNFPMSTPLRFYYEIEETSDDYHYDTYEDAQLACLKKLIEIVKNK